MKTPSRRYSNFICLLLMMASIAIDLPAEAQMNASVVPDSAPPQVKIAIAPFDDRISAIGRLSDVIRTDLKLYGDVDLIDSSDVLSDNASIDYPGWKMRGAGDVAVGSVSRLADGRVGVRYRLYDTVLGKQISGFGLSTSEDHMRFTAHMIANDILKRVAGRRGDFSTRIAYVEHNSVYSIDVADYDGANVVQAVRSSKPVSALSWSPDGKRLAYVSMENNKSVVYVQNLVSGVRTLVANYEGDSSSPSWSPDGNLLAITVTRSDTARIFLIKSEGGEARQLTNNQDSETAPHFSPDGKSLYFARIAAGGAQIYRLNLAGGDAEKLAVDAAWVGRLCVSPDGKSLLFVSRSGDSPHVMLSLLDLATGRIRQLSEADDDATPCFSPSGRLIMVDAPSPAGRILKAMSLEGSVKYQITLRHGDINYATWGPFTD